MYKKLELCKARHSTPAEGAIFETEVNPLDLGGMADVVAEKLSGCTCLDLYVTGLTVALVEVLKYCTAHNVAVTLWHFNRESGDYYAQEWV